MCLNENSCCPFSCKRSNDSSDNNSKYVSSDNEIIVIERKYGCYRLGIFVATIIVMLLILGTIPVTLTIKNNQIVLISLCTSLAFVAILLSLFIYWQQKQATRQKEWTTRPFTIRKENKNGMYTAVPTSPSSRTSWMFWHSNNKNDYVDHPLRSPSIRHNPTKISTLQQVSEAPQYTTIV